MRSVALGRWFCENATMTTPPRRRWYQFGIGTMFCLMVVIALAVYAIGEHRLRLKAEADSRLIQREIGVFEFNPATGKDFETWVQEVRQRLLTTGKTK
jgi:hypothetical protein